jgi:hypothetical protein
MSGIDICGPREIVALFKRFPSLAFMAACAEGLGAIASYKMKKANLSEIQESVCHPVLGGTWLMISKLDDAWKCDTITNVDDLNRDLQSARYLVQIMSGTATIHYDIDSADQEAIDAKIAGLPDFEN